MLYNLVDVTINLGSNEGFGLSNAESMMAGTPVVVNVTGGLQDQIGTRDENGKLIEFTTEFPSNHNGRYKNWGEWAKPVWPTNRSLQGSPPAPYIFDDRPSFEEAAQKVREWYDMGRKARKEAGLKGREFCLGEGGFNAKNMSEQMIKGIEITLEKWKPKEKFELIKAGTKDYIIKPASMGILPTENVN